jgi:hypothetical protein
MKRTLAGTIVLLLVVIAVTWRLLVAAAEQRERATYRRVVAACTAGWTECRARQVLPKVEPDEEPADDETICGYTYSACVEVRP